MNIRFLFSFFLLFGASIPSAYANVMVVGNGLSNSGLLTSCGLARGTVFDPSFHPCLRVGYTQTVGSNKFTVTSSSTSFHLEVNWRRGDGDTFKSVARLSPSSCSEGEQINPDSGVCEAPPSCENGDVWNPDTGLCEPVPEFCDLDSTIDQIFEAEQVCVADGGIFSFDCHNGNDLVGPSLITNCTQPNECVLGMPNFPECLGDLDPTKPVTPPDGFNPEKPDVANPDAPSFDKDTVDDVTPNETTDTALLAAIQNANRDANNAATALNKDMNTGFASVETGLNGISETNKAIGTAIASQSELHHQIFEANKELILQNTGELKHLGTALDKSIGDSSAAITGAIDGLSDKLNGLGDKGSVFANGCESFNCEGDAATCYLARQNWDNTCGTLHKHDELTSALDGLSSSLEIITNDAYDENGAFVGVFTEADKSVDTALDAYDESNGFNFDGGCPASRVYTVLGATFEIDYQPFCDLAIIFRVFVMASAAITSFLMIAKYI